MKRRNRAGRIRPEGAATIAKIQHVGEHVLVEQFVTHLLMQYDVDRLGRSEVATVRPDELDAGEPVVGRDFAGDIDEVGMLDGVHLLGSRSARHERQQAGSRADVEHDITRLHIASDPTVVRLDTDAVAQHLLVRFETGEVVAIDQVIYDTHHAVARRNSLGDESCRRADARVAAFCARLLIRRRLGAGEGRGLGSARHDFVPTVCDRNGRATGRLCPWPL